MAARILPVRYILSEMHCPQQQSASNAVYWEVDSVPIQRHIEYYSIINTEFIRIKPTE